MGLAEKPTYPEIKYRPAIGTVNCPLLEFKVIPPLFVVGALVKPITGVTVPAGMVVEPAGIGVGATPTVPDGMEVGVGAPVIYVTLGQTGGQTGCQAG